MKWPNPGPKRPQAIQKSAGPVFTGRRRWPSPTSWPASFIRPERQGSPRESGLRTGTSSPTCWPRPNCFPWIRTTPPCRFCRFPTSSSGPSTTSISTGTCPSPTRKIWSRWPPTSARYGRRSWPSFRGSSKRSIPRSRRRWSRRPPGERTCFPGQRGSAPNTTPIAWDCAKTPLRSACACGGRWPTGWWPPKCGRGWEAGSGCFSPARRLWRPRWRNFSMRWE